MNDKDMGASLDASELLGFRNFVRTDTDENLGRLHSKIGDQETPPNALGRLFSKVGNGETVLQ